MATVLLLLLAFVVSAALHRKCPIPKTIPIAAAAAATATPNTRSSGDLDRRMEELVGEEDEANGPRPVTANLMGPGLFRYCPSS